MSLISPITEEFIDIIATNRVPIARIPLTFIKRSRLDSWQFVTNLVRLLPGVNLAAISVIYSGTQWQNPMAPACAGIYVLHDMYIGSGPIIPQISSVTRIKPVSTPPLEEFWLYHFEEDTAEFAFCMSVSIRDIQCLVSAEHWENCVPTHIVPIDRIDIYRQLLGIGYDNHPHYLNMGILLRPDLSQAFEKFEWSLYHQDENFYIHFFDPFTPLAVKYHGNHFDVSRFRGQGSAAPGLLWKGEVPDTRLLAWHYQQGVQVFADAAADSRH